MKCNWTTSFVKPYQECGKFAIWKNENWILCDYHKNLLLNSYNQESKIKDLPNWSIISEVIDFEI